MSYLQNWKKYLMGQTPPKKRSFFWGGSRALDEKDFGYVSGRYISVTWKMAAIRQKDNIVNKNRWCQWSWKFFVREEIVLKKKNWFELGLRFLCSIGCGIRIWFDNFGFSSWLRSYWSQWSFVKWVMWNRYILWVQFSFKNVLSPRLRGWRNSNACPEMMDGDATWANNYGVHFEEWLEVTLESTSYVTRVVFKQYRKHSRF